MVIARTLPNEAKRRECAWEAQKHLFHKVLVKLKIRFAGSGTSISILCVVHLVRQELRTPL